MPNSLHEFLSQAIPKAAADLETALLGLPEDKRNWSPMGNARTALDMVAECAILNDMSDVIKQRALRPDFDFAAFGGMKTELAQDGDKLRAQLHETAARAVETVKSVSKEELNDEVTLPWGPSTVAQVLSYPYWNMSYHEGQINYIASMLGCLD